MKEKIKTALFWFILIQPFLDLYWLYNGKLATILPFTLPTIIRIGAVAILIGMFFSQKKSWQKLSQQKWLIAYLILLVVYSIVHLWHVRHFHSVSATDYNYSTTSEIFYLIRMFLPLSVIYFTRELEFTQADFKKVIMGLSGLFSFTIVLSNLFLVSLRSYGDGFISANIFEWFFKQNIGYSHMASKGFFNFANMVSAILFMLLPLMIYFMFQKFNWQIVTLNAVQALAMLEIGTKVAAFGLIGGLILSLLLYFVHRFLIKNEHKNGRAVVAAFIIEIASVAILPFSPAIQRYNYEIYLAQQSDHDLSDETKELEAGLKKYPQEEKRREFLRSFIKENYRAYALNEKFVLHSYPYQNDPEFWLQIMKKPGETRMQNRYLERAMLDKVRATNNNHLDKWLGISYTRESNIFNLERDFTSQIYSMGYVGMLLFIGPYVAILIYGFYKWLTSSKRTYLASSILLAMVFMLAAAFSSGNVMDFLTASFILAFVSGFLLKEFAPKPKNKTKLTV